MHDPYRSHFSAPVAPEVLARAERALDGVWRAVPSVPSDRRSALDLAVSEVLSNVLVHGEGASVIDVEISATAAGVDVTIQDDGPPFPAGVPDLPGLAAEGGRGIALVAAVLDRWSFERHGERNVWRLGVGAPGS